MAKSYLQRITSWSISRLRDYEKCPYYAKLKHLDKRKEPTGPALARGSAIHKLADNYITRKTKKLAPELRYFAKEFKELVEAKAHGEKDSKWGFSQYWKAVDYFDWDRCVLRMVLDTWYVDGDTLVAIDFKTGRYTEDKIEEYHDQLKLYAPGGMIMAPGVAKVDARIYFTDANERERKVHKAADFKKLTTYWDKRSKRMLADTRFDPKPGRYCGHCNFRKSNGGPCKF